MKTLLISGATFGRGDDAIGTILIEKFFTLLADSPVLPETVFFYNTGARLCLPGNLPLALPGLKLIYLDPEQGQVQIVTSEQRLATHVRDLIDVIGLG